MKIAIFENEYESVRGAFDTANLIDFDNQLKFSIFTSSQMADFSLFIDFSAFFVDIDLSTKSVLDGFGVIQKIKDTNQDLLRRIIILTGNNKIKEAMKERNIFDNRIQIIIKPTDYMEITKSLRLIS